MLQSSDELFSELKLVTDNLLSIFIRLIFKPCSQESGNEAVTLMKFLWYLSLNVCSKQDNTYDPVQPTANTIV